MSIAQAKQVEVRQYDRLFNVENPTADKETDYKTHLNPESLTVLKNCYAEPSLLTAKTGTSFQFERLGYFSVDPDSTSEIPVFNRIVSLRDTWK